MKKSSSYKNGRILKKDSKGAIPRSIFIIIFKAQHHCLERHRPQGPSAPLLEAFAELVVQGHPALEPVLEHSQLP